MILPTKHIAAHEALIGAGALILQQVRDSVSLSGLWEAVKSDAAVQTYERFILTLDMLYIIGAIDVEGHMIVRVRA